MMRFILKTKAQGLTLDEYIRDRGRITIITGPLGSGKTFASCQRLFTHLTEQKPNKQGLRKSRWYCVRNTYGELFSTTIKDWLDLFEDLGKFSKGSGIQPPAHHVRFQLPDKTQVDADVVFIALDRPEAIKKVRGSQLTGAWLNEVKELPKAILDMLDFRIGRYPSAMDGGPSWYGIIADTNQCDDDHWLYDLAENVRPEGWNFLTQPGGLTKNHLTGAWEANPAAENLQNLPEGYYTRGKEGKTESWISVNLGNNYGTVEEGRPVYREQYHEDLHLNKNIIYNELEPLVIGFDFGLTPSAVLTQPTARGGVNVLTEIVSFDMGIRQFVEYLLQPLLNKNFPQADIIYVGDPAGNQRAQTNEQTVFKELAELNIYCEPANSNNPDVRLEAVRYYLDSMRDGKPAFQMHPDCVMLRKGFNGGYKYRRLQVVGGDRYTDVPAKNKYSHVHDACQYVCMWYKGSQGYSKENLDAVERLMAKYKQTRMVM